MFVGWEGWSRGLYQWHMSLRRSMSSNSSMSSGLKSRYFFRTWPLSRSHLHSASTGSNKVGICCRRYELGSLTGFFFGALGGFVGDGMWAIVRRYAIWGREDDLWHFCVRSKNKYKWGFSVAATKMRIRFWIVRKNLWCKKSNLTLSRGVLKITSNVYSNCAYAIPYPVEIDSVSWKMMKQGVWWSAHVNMTATS